MVEWVSVSATNWNYNAFQVQVSTTEDYTYKVEYEYNHNIIKNATSISWVTLQNDNWTLNGMNKKYIYIGLKYLFFAFGRNYETLY